MRNRNTRSIAICALAVALIATTVAYAVLQTTLNISGSVTRKGGSWSINFANATITSTRGKASMTTPSINGTNLTFNTTLYQPGDEVTFTFDVVNSGNIAAKLAGVKINSYDNATSTEEFGGSLFEWTNVSPSVLWGQPAADEPRISVKITYADGTTPAIGNTLVATTGTQTFKVVIRYEEFPEGVTPDAEQMAKDETMSFSIGLTYQQA